MLLVATTENKVTVLSYKYIKQERTFKITKLCTVNCSPTDHVQDSSGSINGVLLSSLEESTRHLLTVSTTKGQLLNYNLTSHILPYLTAPEASPR